MYNVHCDWCGKTLGPTDERAVLKVEISRFRKSTLAKRWADETRPTLHLCVATIADGDRLGLGEEWEGEELDCCYLRAMAAVHGREITAPNMGLEWRLVPIETGLTAPPAATPSYVPAEADLKAYLATVAPSHRSRLRNGLGRAGITTLDQIDALSDVDLMKINGVGWKTTCDLRTYIAAARGAATTPPSQSTKVDS